MLEDGNVNRRGFLRALAGGAAIAAGGITLPRPSRERPAVASADRAEGERHLAWVWQFNEDGPKNFIRDVLAANGLGILLKTHDGARWMARWDSSSDAVTGPYQVQLLAEFFESAGVPFHAWCVVQGKDPAQEAVMAAQVLEAGARSLVLDLEPAEAGQYWQGTPADAASYGSQLRHRQPYATISVAPDPRPWQVPVVPMHEFAAFSNEIAPQTYWPNFNSSANYRLLRQWGFHVGGDGVTPELILEVAGMTFNQYGLPIRPIGSGASNPEQWRRFVGHAYRLGMPGVSVWRYGVSNPDIWPLLRDLPPPAAVQPAPVAAAPPVPEQIIAAEAPASEVAAVSEQAPAPSATEVPAEPPPATPIEEAPPLKETQADVSLAAEDSVSSGVWRVAAGGLMTVAGFGLVAGAGMRGEGAPAKTAPQPDSMAA